MYKKRKLLEIISDNWFMSLTLCQDFILYLKSFFFIFILHEFLIHLLSRFYFMDPLDLSSPIKRFCYVHVIRLLEFFSWSQLIINSCLDQGFICLVFWIRQIYYLFSIIFYFCHTTHVSHVVWLQAFFSWLSRRQWTGQPLFFPRVGKMSSRFF